MQPILWDDWYSRSTYLTVPCETLVRYGEWCHTSLLRPARYCCLLRIRSGIGGPNGRSKDQRIHTPTYSIPHIHAPSIETKAQHPCYPIPRDIAAVVSLTLVLAVAAATPSAEPSMCSAKRQEYTSGPGSKAASVFDCGQGRGWFAYDRPNGSIPCLASLALPHDEDLDAQVALNRPNQSLASCNA